MFLKCEISIVIKAILTVFLMMPSMIVLAQTSEAAATETETAETSSAGDNRQRSFNFPRWPDRRQVYRERIPLAPPGPYMSSALSDFSFKRSPFDHGRDRGDSRNDPSDIPRERFSPDMPWPSHTRNDGYGYRRVPANWPESGPENDMPGDTGPDDKWPDRKWPDWPDNYRSNANWPEDTRRDDEWSQKWPSVTRPDEERLDKRRPDDNWSDSRWSDKQE